MLRLNGMDHLGKLDPESEHNKKLQKSVSELVRRIDNLHQSTNRVQDVFSEELLVLRARLRDYTTKLLHSDPEKFGLKYLDVLWRKGWHEPVSLARQMGGGAGGGILLEGHLLAGLGQFHHLLLGLVEQYGSPAGVQLDFMNRAEYGFTGARQGKAGEDRWLKDVVGRCLVWLGDLCRYRMETLETEEQTRRAEVLARKYYSACTRVLPRLGLAYNQLAALSGEANHGLDVLFFYLKCIISREKFDGGESNLERLLEKNEASLVDLTEKEAYRISAVYLIHLVSSVLKDKKEDEIILACQQSLTAIHHVTSVGRVPAAWLLRSAACIIFLILKLGGNNAAASRIGLCQAWLLALTSHLAGVALAGLGRGLWGDKWTEESLDTADSEEVEEKSQGEKKKRKKLVDLLRRRRVSNSGSSADSDLSEDDTEDEASNSLDSFNSESDEDIYFSDSEDSDSDDVVVETVEDDLPTTHRVVETLEAQGVLPALNLCFTWLRFQPEVLTGMGDGGVQFWTKLAKLFTLLNLDSSKYTKDDKVARLKLRNLKAPLEEDFYLRDCEQFADQLKAVDWSLEPAGGRVGEAVARLGRLEEHRDWLVARDECSVRWRAGEGRAVLVNSSLPEKKCVMKHMAELWLKEEVSNLEKNQVESCVFVVDAHALVADMQMVKRVAGYKKFTVIVPQVVIRELDNMKKHVREARLSIRWLERELSRGHQGLQAQEAEQKLKISAPAPPRKDPGWARYCVLQCLAYFAGKQEVIFLTGDQEIIQGRHTLALKVLQEYGVRVEPVDNFMQRFLGLRDVVTERKRPGGGDMRMRRGWRRSDRPGGNDRAEKERSRDRKKDIG